MLTNCFFSIFDQLRKLFSGNLSFENPHDHPEEATDMFESKINLKQ